MGPIFNEKVVKKQNLWVREQCTSALFMIDLVKQCGWEERKKKKIAAQDSAENAESKQVLKVVTEFKWALKVVSLIYAYHNLNKQIHKSLFRASEKFITIQLNQFTWVPQQYNCGEMVGSTYRFYLENVYRHKKFHTRIM